MDRNELQAIADDCLTVAWAKFSRLYTLKKPCPTIIINNRLKTTAGRCDYLKRVIDLAPIMFAENISEYRRVIIPHEIAHQIAWDIFEAPGHCPKWKSIMVKFGLSPDRCHTLSSSAMRKSRKALCVRKFIRSMLDD